MEKETFYYLNTKTVRVLFPEDRFVSDVDALVSYLNVSEQGVAPKCWPLEWKYSFRGAKICPPSECKVFLLVDRQDYWFTVRRAFRWLGENLCSIQSAESPHMNLILFREKEKDEEPPAEEPVAMRTRSRTARLRLL